MFTLVGPSRAGFIVNLTETGGNVVATGSGTINTADLAFDFSGTGTSALYPNNGEAIFGPDSYVNVDAYIANLVGPASFGDGFVSRASSGTGDIVGIDIPYYIDLPSNYLSGSMLSSSDTWSGQTFASLGLTPGTYTWTWGTGANADFFTMNIGVSSVPEPSSLLLASGGLGIVALAVLARRRQAWGD
jgi:hypothetical protein